VIREIASHLDPKTLLALTRTCKVTRALVLDPSSTPIWVQAREGEGIPELTSKALSEVTLARLLFTTSCCVCGKSSAQKLDLTLLIRCCAKCFKAK